MALKQGDAVHLDAFCSMCEASYYRTARPLVVGRDKITPDLFVPIKAGTPPPNPDSPTCPTCANTLRFVAATGAPVQAPEPADPETESSYRRSAVVQSVEQRSVKPVVGGRGEAPSAQAPSTPPRGASGARTETLFAVEPDEQVVDIKDVGEGYLVVTNRRIVRVEY